MTETKQLLERAGRAFDPPTDVMDTLVTRRDRKRRSERGRAWVLGLAIAIGLGWLGSVVTGSAPLPADEPLPSTPLVHPELVWPQIEPRGGAAGPGARGRR